MNGVSSSQAVWCVKDGSIRTVTMSELMGAYLSEQLYRYKPYTMADGPDKPCSSTGIGEVIDNGSALMVKVTTVDGATLTMPADGVMFDIEEFDPVHYGFSFPTKAKYFVGTMSGVKKPARRNIAKYEIVGSGSVYTLPLTNFLTAGYALVLG